MASTIPSTSAFWLPTVRAMVKDPIAALRQYHSRYGDMFRVVMGPGVRYAIVHPDWVDEVLVRQQKKVVKSKTYKEVLPLLTGEGLLGTDGEKWRSHRRLAQPAFHKKYLATIYDIKLNIISDYLGELGKQDQPVVWNNEMTMLTLDVVTRSLMGEGIRGDASAMHKAMDEALDFLITISLNPIKRALQHLNGSRKRYDQQKAYIDTLVDSMIAERRKDGNEEKYDLMAMLMTATDEDSGTTLDDEALKGELLTIFLAGHETSANAMSWGLVMVLQHPEVLARLREEVDTVLGDQLPTFEQLFALPYTRQVVDEVLRLRPSAWGIGRMVAEPIDINGHTFPVGTELMLPLYLVHTHPEFWENPLAFDPDRFGPERKDSINPKAYIPFGSGPRMCIGNHFAIIEMLLILALTVQRFDMELLTQEVKGQATFTWRPITPIRITLTPRK